MKILVVSDSHGAYSTLRSIVRRQSKAEVVLFLGDGEEDYNSVRMEFPEKMFIGVRGNNDWCSGLKNTELITIEGIKILMTHGHTYHVKYGLEELKTSGRSAGADIVLFGHTHVQHTEYEDGMYIMNPGAVANWPGQYGVIDIQNGVIDIQNGQILLNTVKN